MPRSIVWTLLIAGWLTLPARAEFVTVHDFGDLRFWAGSGANEAALVAYFADPVYGDGAAPAAVAWGYRWDGPQTQADMLFALAGSITLVGGAPPVPPAPQPGSDPRLAIDVLYYSGFGVTGYLVTALRYDQVGLPAPWSQTLREITSRSPPDIAPYSVVPATGTAWPAGGVLDLIADTGISDTSLHDRGWYGFVAAEYAIIPSDPPVFVGFPATFTFDQPVAAVPEPAALVPVACGCMALGIWVRSRTRRATLEAGSAARRGTRNPT